MANNDKLVYGGDLMIFLGENETPAAFSTNATLTLNLSEREISSKDSGDYTEVVGGKFDWSMTTDALMNLTGITGTLSTKEVLQYFLAKVPVEIIFGSKSGTTPSWTVDTSKVYFTGTALITSMSFNASNGETATYSVNFKGTGALSI